VRRVKKPDRDSLGKMRNRTEEGQGRQSAWKKQFRVMLLSSAKAKKEESSTEAKWRGGTKEYRGKKKADKHGALCIGWKGEKRERGKHQAWVGGFAESGELVKYDVKQAEKRGGKEKRRKTRRQQGGGGFGRRRVTHIARQRAEKKEKVGK